MIIRTLLEWESASYGDGPGSVPRWAAERLGRAAAASKLGEQAVELRLHDLRARHVVGVIAAEGCALEILPKIDFEQNGQDATRVRDQLVHMLAVAFDLDVASGAAASLGTQRENLLEVLIGLFARKLVDAVRQGMPRRYVRQEDDLPTLRGRLDVRRQFSTLAASPQRLACRFDEMSPDIALNQIMKAAVAKLTKLSRSTANQRVLRELGAVYVDVSAIPSRDLRWDEVVIDRTSERWRELLRLAQLLLGERFQTTSSGGSEGASLLFDMNALFEAYVARMLARVLAGTSLTVVRQGGGLFCLRDEAGRSRFQTVPDILVKQGSETVMVIDTKWKRIVDQADHDKQGVLQADIYQMMAYARLHRCSDLVLLYPHHGALRRPSPLQSRHSIAPDHVKTLTFASVDVTSHRSAQASLMKSLERLVHRQALHAEAPAA